ncbi:hypothetical protein H4R34_001283 [Dimargaris verticillata]|uniref:Uncharacterized protein n=1 Tax=Dimargaris verticillata TaxID=2761393 RepID=A0A9W8B8U7_9FUNG|nr:hypothetical protein H4R34_001283 [Dimargaris verticillata]
MSHDPGTLSVYVAGGLAALGMVGAAVWYLIRDHSRHHDLKVLRHRVHEYMRQFQEIRNESNTIEHDTLGPLLPHFTPGTEDAAYLVGNQKHVDNALNYASELLLRQLEAMDGVPVRRVLDPLNPAQLAHRGQRDGSAYQVSDEQHAALAKLKEKRRHLARHINKQLAQVDEMTRQFKAVLAGHA